MAHNSTRNVGGSVVRRQGSPNASVAEQAVDQVSSVDIAANPDRKSLVIQNSGITAVGVGVDHATSQVGPVLAGGNVADDGKGGSITFKFYTGQVVLYDLSAAGTGGSVRIFEVDGLT